MRITLVISGLSGGGAERICVNLANAWSRRGYQPTILTISQHGRPPAYTIEPGVEVRDIGWRRVVYDYELNHSLVMPIVNGLGNAGCTELIHDITVLSLLRYAILSTRCDVVVSFIDYTNVRVLAAMQESNVPVIVCEVTDARQVLLQGWWQRVREILYRHAAAVVAPHPTIAEWFTRLGASARSIHNPLEPPSAPIPSMRDSRWRVITLSRLSAEKRPEFLLRAFASITDRNPNWDLEFYGTGPQQNSLEHLAEDLAPAGRIRIRGFTSDPYGALSGADIFVSASQIEGFGNSIWEALACGVPVIAMDAGPAVRALVRNGVDGLIVWENSMPALAAALERLMSDDDERKSFASRAPEVVERFSMQAALRKWDELLSLFRTH